MSGAFLSRHFEIHRDHLRVRKTGARVDFDLAVGKEAFDWLVFYFTMLGWRLAGALRGRPRARICCLPDGLRPWYLLWPSAIAARIEVTRALENADAIAFFDDATRSTTPALAASATPRRINFDCPDVSKSRVAEVFEAVFGYPLAVDPASHIGPMVEKSEFNGAHDGRVVEGPCAPRDGFVYQRVVDNARPDGLVEDLRCPTVFGRIGPVFLKRRPVGDRFANINAQVELSTAEACFSADERARLSAFLHAMRLDWGGIDVLRDKSDGRLYVVDVNKTDMGPPTALALGKKLKSVSALGRMLAEELGEAAAEREELRQEEAKAAQ